MAGRRTIKGMWSVTAGVGRGLVNGVGSPDLRVFAWLDFTPDVRDRDDDGIPDTTTSAPISPRTATASRTRTAAPIPTTTATASPTRKDKCPNEAEDIDGFEDDDGCPDPDNDKDGIADLHDECPNEPEDRKAAKPERRLPAIQTDNDGDGIPDDDRQVPERARGQGRLPGRRRLPRSRQRRRRHPRRAATSARTSPRTRTASRTTTAAPIPTTTTTASPTRSDKCPNEPETINGFQDDDGCPDPGPEWGRLGEGKIRGRREDRLRQPRRQGHAARRRPPRW